MAWSSILPLIIAQAQPEAAPANTSGVLQLLIAIAVIAGSFGAGALIARRLRMPDYTFRIGLVLFTLIASLAINFFGWPPKRGIDLSGGVVLVYELDRASSRPEQMQAVAARVQEQLGTDNPEKLEARVAGSDEIEVTLPKGGDASQVERAIAELRTTSDIRLTSAPSRTVDGNKVLVFKVDSDQRNVDMSKLIAAVGRRINPSGIKELTIRQYGAEQLEIIIPEVDEREVESIKRQISTSGLLEFRIVANDRDDRDIITAARKTPGRDVYIGGKLVGRWVQVSPEMRDAAAAELRNTQARGQEILVRIDPFNVDGRYLTRASKDSAQGGYAVDFSFDSTGAQKFGDLTTRNLPDAATGFHRRLGIILDNVMISAPNLNSAIHDRGQITGRFTEAEVEFLVGVLNAGSLPASLRPEPISQQRISSQLGDDTIRRGTESMVISTAAILVFMLVYYRFCGMVANVAVVLNMVVTVALMILIKAAFTLPGLAGLVLTVGMAVDANVLIYERMREETERGASLRMAIRNGFSRAMATIIDSHVTTLVSAAVLFMIGTDQIKGFAVTLILGLLMSLFTAVYVARVLFDIAEKQGWLKRLNMMHLIGHTHFDFIRFLTPAIAISAMIVAVGAVATVMRGSELLDIDFTGGSSVQVLFAEDKPQDIADVRAAVADLPDVAVSSVGDNNLEFKVDTSNRDIHEVQDDLKKAFGDKLLTYRMTFGPLSMIEAEKPAGEKPAAGETPAADSKPQSDSGAEAKPAVEPAKTDETAPKSEEPAPKSEEPAPKSEEPAPKSEEPAPKSEEPAPKTEEAPKENSGAGFSPRSHVISTLLVAQADPAADQKPEPAAEPAAATKAEEAPAAQKADAAEATKPQAEAEPKAEAPQPDESKPAAAAPAATEPASTSVETPSGLVGGTRVTLNFPQVISYAPLREMVDKELAELKLTNANYEIRNPKYQLGSDARYPEWTLESSLNREQTEQLLSKMQERLSSTPVFPSSNQIGGKVAGDTQLMALYALLASMLIIVIYIWIRFQNVMFGVAAVLALVHDVLVTVAFLAMSYYLSPYLGWLLVDPFKISLAVVAALLTIVGFSINDTIVVFDRIREVRGKSPHLTPDMVNLSVNATLSRTFLTSGTVMIASVILYFVGGPGIHAFAYAMVVGVVAGTYSSVYIAAPILLWMKKPPANPTKLGGQDRPAAAGLSRK